MTWNWPFSISNSNIIPHVPLTLSPPLSDRRLPAMTSSSTNQIRHFDHLNLAAHPLLDQKHQTMVFVFRRAVVAAAASTNTTPRRYFHRRYLGATVLPDMRFSKFLLKVVKNDLLWSWAEVILEKGMRIEDVRMGKENERTQNKVVRERVTKISLSFLRT